MLVEIENARQIKDEGFRRWFSDDFFDLIVWYDERREIRGFQLCYDKHQNERAVTWRREGGFSHHRVDDGETTRGAAGHPMSPILVRDGVFEVHPVAERFRSASANIEPSLAGFVYRTMLDYPAP